MTGETAARNPYDYENRAGIRPISWEDFHGLCKGLAVAVASFQPEIILPIGRAGYYPGTLLAHMLQVEIYPVRLSRRVKDVVTYQAMPRHLLQSSPQPLYGQGFLGPAIDIALGCPDGVGCNSQPFKNAVGVRLQN